MEIVCPECGFSRDVPPNRLPAGAVIATCPECACRFRFFPESGMSENLSLHTSAEAVTGEQAECRDDPLPPGAVIPGDDEEDPRLTASRAYAREASRLENEEEEDAAEEAVVVNPWAEAPEKCGWFAAFYQTILRVMFAAPRFFSGLTPHTRQTRELGFYIIVGVLQVAIERSWGSILASVMASAAANDPQLAAMLLLLAPEANPAVTILIRTFMLVLQLYFFSALIHLACRYAAPKNADFSLIFQVLAYSAAPALLCVVPLLGSLAGFVWSTACMLTGCRSALRLTWPQTLLSFAPVFVVVLVILQLFLNARV
ncbi:MAG: zinc-ribbon domain-containing protein [Desulfovibrio sp.]|nr:zinc-ribbon domain-containing protein [Desulfovibrio sp.]